MSLQGQRQILAAALSTVGDVRGVTKRPAVPNTGDAWPRLAVLDHDAGDAFMVTWSIAVIVPQDEVAAEEWWDVHWPPLYFALKPVAFVDRAVPVTVPTAEGAELLAFDITVRTEE
jgi:hypothetical protein